MGERKEQKERFPIGFVAGRVDEIASEGNQWDFRWRKDIRPTEKGKVRMKCMQSWSSAKRDLCVGKERGRTQMRRQTN
jgi:hypothetical protein